MLNTDKSTGLNRKPVIALGLVASLLLQSVVSCSNFAEAGYGDSESAAESKGAEYGKFRYQNENRTYLLYTPGSYNKDRPAALIVALHGAHGDAKKTAARTDFNEIADREGFLVLYPEGISHHWNDGRSTTPSKADDVGFITSLIDHIAKQRNIDSKRVYVTGLSNGGIMTQRLACEAPDRFAAFAAVIANMPLELEAVCKTSPPVPIMLINGKADPLMPWVGGEIKQGRFLGSGGGGAILSAEKTARFWADKDRCSKSFEHENLPDRDPNDGTRIEKFIYTGCKDGTEVILFGVEGGGHTWPGSKIKPFARISGKVSQDMNASEVMWVFFKRHSGQ
jgi:polyhydroxybutyrate depolymerase